MRVRHACKGGCARSWRAAWDREEVEESSEEVEVVVEVESAWHQHAAAAAHERAGVHETRRPHGVQRSTLMIAVARVHGEHESLAPQTAGQWTPAWAAQALVEWRAREMRASE